MHKIKIGIMKKGDSVLFVNERMIAIQRKNGEVELIALKNSNDNNLPMLDLENSIIITYGEGYVETTAEGKNGDIKITNF